MGRDVFVIAELGSNPAPKWDLSRYCIAAAKAGAEAVKVQLWRAEHFPEAERAVKKVLEFPRRQLFAFVCVAHEHGLRAGASVFDDAAVRLAAEHCDFIKLAAREQGNMTLFSAALRASGRYHKPLYRSISNWSEYGAGRNTGPIDLFAIQKYPAGMVESLLSVFGSWRFAVRGRLRGWGWSSHTRGWLDCALAVWLGATVIEKHFALTADEIEAGHSLLPAEFKRLVEQCHRKSFARF